MVATKRVLVIDDDKIVCALIGKVVQRHGADVTVVADGKAAAEALRGEERFDVIFLDLIFPFASGWDILRSLKAGPGTRGIPVVIFSGTKLSYQEKARLSRNAVAYVDKETFDLEKFDNLVADVLSDKGAEGMSASVGRKAERGGRI